MLKSLKKMLVGSALLAMSGLQLAQATPVLIQDFWSKDKNNQDVKFASFVVDTGKASQSVGSIYQSASWESFTLLGQPVINPGFNFYVEFDISDLSKGFTFIQFDLQDVTKTYNFFGLLNALDNLRYFDVTLANVPYGNPAGLVLSDDDIRTPNATVDAPASVVLLVLGMAAVATRRSRKLSN